jgi:hypothetical protein
VIFSVGGGTAAEALARALGELAAWRAESTPRGLDVLVLGKPHGRALEVACVARN